MDFLSNPEFWARLLAVIVGDLLLAGDNALVIALAVRKLPKRQQFWGRIWGTLGAVVLRVLGIMVVTYLLKIPFLQLIGGVLLLVIAWKLIRQETEKEEHVPEARSLLNAIGVIAAADVVMSLDNVLAIAGVAKGDFKLVVFGIALSLPLVVFGSGLLSLLIARHAWIVWIGGGILGYVAGEMMLRDQWLAGVVEPLGPWVMHGFPDVLGGVLTALGWVFARGAGKTSGGGS